MDSANLLRIIECGLAPVAKAHGGKVEVAADPDHVLEMLAASAPNTWRIILSFGGDEAVEPDDSPGITKWNLQTTVQAARGLTIPSAASTYKESASGRDPLLYLAALTSQWIRGFSGTTDDIDNRGFRHIASQWLVIDTLPTRQLMLTHSVRLKLDPPIDVPLTF